MKRRARKPAAYWMAIALTAALSACGAARPADSDVPAGCCGPIPYSTEHTVTGSIGQPVHVTWSTGTGIVTLHQVKWVPIDGPLTGTKLMMEVTFEASTGTVNYGRLSWLESDSIGRADVVQTPLINDKNLHELPDSATLRAGQKDRGWAAFLIIDPPTPPVMIHLNEYETTIRLVTWTIDGPPPQAIHTPTPTPLPSDPNRPALNCPGTVAAVNLGHPADFVAQSSPVEAAQRFVRAGIVGGLNISTHATWTLGPANDSGTYVITEGAVLHAVQSPRNNTWVIDEEQHCA